MRKLLIHTIPPVYDSNSKVLILGSFPSPKSRESGFYYGHGQNRFWKILECVFDRAVPDEIQGKKKFLHENKIALWDVVYSCEIKGASDSSIKNAVANDFAIIFASADIKAVFTCGVQATKLYNKLTEKTSVYLPSPSPANCAMDFSKLCAEYSKIKEFM